MRYMMVPTITFENADGISYSVKSMREYPGYMMKKTMPTGGVQCLDEIACQADVFGDGCESLTYALFDYNRIDLSNAGYDLTKLREIKVPVI